MISNVTAGHIYVETSIRSIAGTHGDTIRCV